MKAEAGWVFDERDEEAARLFASLGHTRAVSRVLVFLAQVAEATSPEIEHATGLRQPEVSVAMQDLRRLAWVSKRDLKRSGKGRPVHCYRLMVQLSEVVAQLEVEARRRAEALEEALQRLHKMTVVF